MWLSFLSINSFATSAKYMLSRIFLWTCTINKACSRLFPVIDVRYAFMHFKLEKIPSISAFVACESKSNHTIFPASLIKLLLLYLAILLTTIVSLSLSSNKLGSTFSLLISIEKVLSCNWWLLVVSFDIIRNYKCKFQVRFSNKMDFLLTCRYLNRGWTLL